METKTDRIIYDVNDLKTIFSGDFEQIQHLLAAGEFKEIFQLRQSTGIIVVEDFINYAEGTNNWCQEDLEAFERNLRKTNASYRYFLSKLTGQTSKAFTEKELGALWIVHCIMLDEWRNAQPTDIYGRIPEDSLEGYAHSIETISMRKERRRLNRLGLISSENRGRKANAFDNIYRRWVLRLLPWLRDHKDFKDEREAFDFIGLLLILGNHTEFRPQYKERNPHEKYYDKEGNKHFREIPFKDYVYGRLKAIYYRNKGKAYRAFN